MSAKKKTSMVDGYTALRAAQEAARHGKGDPLRAGQEERQAAREAAQGASGDKAKAPGTRIGRSVMPSKREIVCPECDFVSEVTGKLALFVCQQCRHRLKLDDKNISGECEEDVETGGNITVEVDAVLKKGVHVTGNDIVLKGKMKGGSVRACRRLVIEEGAEPDWNNIRFRDLHIQTGYELQSGKVVRGRHVEVHGTYIGTMELDGCCTIRAGGCVRGKLKAAGLAVDDGGGLIAQLDISPDYAPKPEPKKPPVKKAAGKKAPVRKVDPKKE